MDNKRLRQHGQLRCSEICIDIYVDLLIQRGKKEKDLYKIIGCGSEAGYRERGNRILSSIIGWKFLA